MFQTAAGYRQNESRKGNVPENLETVFRNSKKKTNYLSDLFPVVTLFRWPFFCDRVASIRMSIFHIYLLFLHVHLFHSNCNRNQFYRIIIIFVSTQNVCAPSVLLRHPFACKIESRNSFSFEMFCLLHSSAAVKLAARNNEKNDRIDTHRHSCITRRRQQRHSDDKIKKKTEKWMPEKCEM